MKTKLSYVILIAMTMVFTNCKKDSVVKPDFNADGNDLNATVMAASGVPINSVFTIAGGPYTTGPTLVNGTGKNARFNSPSGIQLMGDGTIYVADTRNDIIRIVSPAGDVSSFSVPNKVLLDPVWWIRGPEYVGIDNNGVIFIIDRERVTQNLRLVIYSPNSYLIGGTWNDFYDTRDLVKDPYGNAFWSIEGNNIRKIVARASDSYYTWTYLQFTNKYLPDNPGNYTYPALFAGYNGVIYFTYKGKIYKHKKDNTGALIFPDLTFNNITCIIANKDSRTLYVADNGYIKRIDNGRLTTIAGPNKTNTDSRDGVGFKADVSAKYLALSKDESTIYFSDSRANAIRKIVLR
jgi:hypothetical protein